MEKELKIKTSCKAAAAEEEEDDLPVSPSGYYFNSSVLSLTILGVLEIEVPIDESQAMVHLHDIFLPVNPRFSSSMVSGRNKKKKWKKVEVNFEDHIKIPIFPTDSPLEHYDDAFDEYLTKIAMEPLPQDRPLWEVHIVKYPTSKASGHFVFKLHHALGDGYSLIGALLSCSQRADDPSVPLTFPIFRTKNNRPSVGYCQRIITGVSRTICVAYNTLCDYGTNILKSIVIEDDRTPIRSGNEGLEHKPISISTMEFSIDKIKQIKNELGVVVSKMFHKMLRNTSIVLSNMVGPIEKMTVAKHPVKGLYFIVTGAPMSVEIAILSYMQTLRICIGVEKNFIDLQEFKSCIQEAFDQIFDAATKKGK